MHKDIMENLARSYPEILNTAIPYASDIERMDWNVCRWAVLSTKVVHGCL